jgi:hypothetical protein
MIVYRHLKPNGEVFYIGIAKIFNPLDEGFLLYDSFLLLLNKLV